MQIFAALDLAARQRAKGRPSMFPRPFAKGTYSLNQSELFKDIHRHLDKCEKQLEGESLVNVLPDSVVKPLHRRRIKLQSKMVYTTSSPVELKKKENIGGNLQWFPQGTPFTSQLPCLRQAQVQESCKDQGALQVPAHVRYLKCPAWSHCGEPNGHCNQEQDIGGPKTTHVGKTMSCLPSPSHHHK